MKPIQTRYAGYLFRSRLEARWAVFFDAMGLRWKYEPEGFHLPSGRRYLPDFLVTLHNEQLWVEVKPNEGDESPFEEFMANLEGDAVGTVLHDIPDPREAHNVCNFVYYKGSDPTRYWSGPDGGQDCTYLFCICEACGAVGFEFDGRSARIGCGCDIHKGSDKNYTPGHPRILSAFAKARSARFEHEAREVWT